MRCCNWKAAGDRRVSFEFPRASLHHPCEFAPATSVYEHLRTGAHNLNDPGFSIRTARSQTEHARTCGISGNRPCSVPIPRDLRSQCISDI